MAGKAIRLSPPHMAHGHNTPMGWAKGALSPQGLAQTGHLVPVTLLPTSSVSVHVFVSVHTGTRAGGPASQGLGPALLDAVRKAER